MTEIASKEDLLFKPNKELDEIQQEGEDNIYASAKEFDELDIIKDKENLIEALYANHFDKPSQIQGKALPMILTPPYKSLIAQSQNGTGKTLTFVLAMLARIDAEVKQLQCICVVHSRILAKMIYDDYFAKFVPYYPVTIQLLFKNPPYTYDPETQGPAQILIATPQYLDNHIDEFQLNSVRVFVIDEADQSLEIPTFHQFFDMILSKLTKDRYQLLLFSASITDQVYQFMNTYMSTSNRIILEKNKLFVPTNDHFNINIRYDARVYALIQIFDYLQASHSFVFVQKKDKCTEIQNALKERGYSSEILTGNLRPAQRDLVLQRFKDNKFNVLITTDIASRGIDIPACRLVLNFDMPSKMKKESADAAKKVFEPDPISYLHRQGRTGRFGKFGKVINFLTCELDRNLVRMLSNYPYNLKFKEIPVEQLSMFQNLEEI
ncbi:ATP-dependent RNA helicase DBP5 [Histomonas meleagridis]|uniref:ATP-dependent RNA helicase DBP5 n=1 Tax=Histomonas meleagridis TaxID=135588 RepID=UPI0035597E7B|nr:ATP-dependent RNA helicase DBP5 [Histomonas meleagridis]KAH0803570.1 ATP-dependent RNA helicase DBP5 [Histomonas meleagridis]